MQKEELSRTQKAMGDFRFHLRQMQSHKAPNSMDLLPLTSRMNFGGATLKMV